MKLNKLTLSNFKGIHGFVLEADGCNIEVRGHTGTGKTTLLDSVLWLLFGKDSDGRSDFAVTPLLPDGTAVRNIVTSVEAQFEIDGNNITLKREWHEKVVKGQLSGYTGKFFVDGAGIKQKEFMETIERYGISEANFRLLTNIFSFFNLKWQEQRDILLDMAGGDTTPEGFEDILAALGNNLDIDQVRKIYQDQLKLSRKNAETCAIRIDEVRSSIGGVTEEADIDVYVQRKQDLEKVLNELQAAKALAQKNLALLSEKTNELHNAETRLVSLKTRITMANEPKRPDYTSKLVEEKSQLRRDVVAYESECKSLLWAIEKDKTTVAQLCVDKEKAIDERKKLMESLKAPQLVCPTCSQPINDAGKAAVEADISAKLQKIDILGVSIAKQVSEAEESIQKNDKFLSTNLSCKTDAEKRIKAIEAQIESETKREENDYQIAIINGDGAINFSEYPDYVEMETEVNRLKQAVADISAMDNSVSLSAQETKIIADIQELSERTTRHDEIQRANKRIADLLTEQRESAQAEADAQKMLDRIQEYVHAESKLLQMAVQAHFDMVEFKLFDVKLNGNIEACCEATYKGVSYSDCSRGQKIMMGVDIVNALSKYYEFTPFLFIDNREALTIPFIRPYAGQTIDLYAERGINVLRYRKVEE